MAEVTFYVGDEDTEDFEEKLVKLLMATKELGPILHMAVMAQTIGYIMAMNPVLDFEEVMKTTGMNVAHGYSNAIHDLMEKTASDKGAMN